MHGQEPGAPIPPTFSAVPSIHGPISTGPDSAGSPIKGTGATLNRVYFAYGTSSNGVMQVVDRSNLRSSAPTDFTSAEIGRLVMNPINSAHTSFPIGNIAVPDFAPDAAGTVRDFVVATSEETFN